MSSWSIRVGKDMRGKTDVGTHESVKAVESAVRSLELSGDFFRPRLEKDNQHFASTLTGVCVFLLPAEHQFIIFSLVSFPSYMWWEVLCMALREFITYLFELKNASSYSCKHTSCANALFTPSGSNNPSLKLITCSMYALCFILQTHITMLLYMKPAELHSVCKAASCYLIYHAVDIKRNSESQYLQIRFVGVKEKYNFMPDGAPSAESALLKSCFIKLSQIWYPLLLQLLPVLLNR